MELFFRLFEDRNKRMRRHINRLERKIDLLESHIEEIHSNHRTFEHIVEKKTNIEIPIEINQLKTELKNKMDDNTAKIMDLMEEKFLPYPLKQEHTLVSEEIVEIKEEPKIEISKKIIPEIKTIYEGTKKNMLENEILNYVDISDIKISDLKRIIIEENKLCSKATFYRTIKNLQKRREISVVVLNNESILTKIRKILEI